MLLNGDVANITININQLPTIEESNLFITWGTNIEPDAPGTSGEVTQEEINEAFASYIAENPPETQLQLDDTLKVTDGILGVNTTEIVETGNSLPVTANAVAKEVGDIGDAMEDI